MAVGYDYTDVDFARSVAKGIIIEYKNGAWSRADFPEVSGNWQLNAVSFYNNQHGWAVGLDKEKNAGAILQFQDGKWKSVQLPSPAYEKWNL